MAAGITQPGGGANPILIEDNANAAAGGDGSYSFADISAVFPALCIDLGTTPKSYRMTVSLINGDGVGTAVTTLKDSDCFVVFDNTRNYTVSTTGRANRFTEFGVLVDGTKDSARSGVSLVLGAATTIQGNAKFYGCSIKVTTGNLTLAPGQTGLNYEIVNSIIYVAGGSAALGISSVANVNTVYNVDITAGNAAVGAIGNFGADFAERITVALNAAGTYHLRTNSIFTATDLVCIGVGAGTGAQLRLGNAGSNLVRPTWDQNIAISDGTHAGTTSEWWPYDVIVTDGALTPLVGLPFTLVDGFGATVINTVTDASGRLTFGSGATANCVKVVTRTGATPTYQGPWTVRVNQGGGANSSYPTKTETFNWPSTATWLTTNVQYQDMFDIIQLVPPGGGPTNWNEHQIGGLGI